MNRPIIFRVRMSETERILVKRLAELEGMKASEFCRQAIREAAKARGIPSVGMATLYADTLEVQK